MKLWMSITIALWMAAALPAAAQELRSLRLGAGSVSSVEFQIGGLIGNIISNPPGASNCSEPAACGLPGLVATVLRTDSAAATVDGIAQGTLDGGLVNADLLWRAERGLGEFSRRPVTNLRHVATLYDETLLILVRRDGGPKNLTEVRAGKLAIIDPEGAERAPVRALLAAYKLDEPTRRSEPMTLDRALAKLSVGELDALIVRTPEPEALLARVQFPTPLAALALSDTVVGELTKAYPFFVATRLAGAGGVDAGAALAIPMQWVVNAEIEDDVVRASLSALLHPQNRAVLLGGNPAVSQIRRAHGLAGQVLALHPGAEAYFRRATPDK